MHIVALLGILASLAAYRLSYPRGEHGQPRLYFALAAIHVCAAVVYWQFAANETSDAKTYYFDRMGFARQEFRLGTIFVVKSVRFLRDMFGGSFLDYFLFFQLFGMVGIAFILRAMREVSTDLGQAVPIWMYGLFFLPGLHFWTSGIGKDGALFAGVALCVWAMIAIDRRFPLLIAVVAAITLIRPHIAALVAIATIASLLFDARIRLMYKVPLGLLNLGGLILVLGSMQTAFGLNSLDPEALSEFIASKQEYGFKQASTPLDLPFPLRVATLLFRPLFFDSDGAFGLIVSLENAVLIGIFATLAFRAPTLLRLSLSVTYVRFCLIFALGLILLLSIFSYNVGLGLRQKFMVMPPILLLFATVILYRRARTAGAPQPAPPAMAYLSPEAPPQA